MLAAGSTADLALRIWNGEYRRGFSFVRPPGHHAVSNQAMGFCFFNNIAIAAAAVLEAAPQARVAIVDFDLHHGNGTQWSFYDRPEVLFLSSHRYPFYPGTGAFAELGNGKGKGATINLPLNSNFGDSFFISLYTQIVAPALEAFRPDMIFVSAGFDGHVLDPMQGFRLSTEGYAKLADLLIHSAEKISGKILFCLEGGYHPEALKASCAAVLNRILEAPRQIYSLSHDGKTDLGEAALIEEFRGGLIPYFPELRLNG